MNDFGLAFHHLGLACSDEAAGILFLSGLFYNIGERCYDPCQKVYLRFCTADAQLPIELITRADSDGPLNNYLKNCTGLVYHICYSSPDSAQSLAAMRRAGLRVLPISLPTPAPLFEGRAVSFHMIKGIGLLELLHE
jgi:hypothetical protein